SSTQADGAQSSQVPVPLPEDPYEAIRQTYLDGSDTESEPFKDPVETETLESLPDITPPIYLVESEGSDTSGVRSTLSDSTTPLSPDHPLAHTTPALVPILRMTARIAEVASMSEFAFRKRFRSSYESSPSLSPLDLPSRKRYRGTSELVEDSEEDNDEEDEEIEESLDSDNLSKDAEDEGPTAEDEDLAAGDEGLAAGSRALGHSVKSDGLSLEEEEAVFEGQQQAVLPTVATWTDPEDGMVYIDVPTYPPPPPVQTPPSPKWTSGSLPVSPSPSVVPSPISSPMIPLTVPSLVASPATAETEGFLTELGAQVEMQGGLIRNHAVQLEELSPALFERYDRDIGELFTRSEAVRDEIFSQRYRFRSLEYEQERGENRDLLLQLAEERHARLELAEVVDSMRRGQEPKGGA
ncbi:hypothetical protein Tco_0633059, partial [Tanacetum coccineum]